MTENQKEIIALIEKKLESLGQAGAEGLEATVRYTVVCGVTKAIGLVLVSLLAVLVARYLIKLFIKCREENNALEQKNEHRYVDRGDEVACCTVGVVLGVFSLATFSIAISQIPKIVSPLGHLINNALLN